jgi:hypothetical protein
MDRYLTDSQKESIKLARRNFYNQADPANRFTESEARMRLASNPELALLIENPRAEYGTPQYYADLSTLDPLLERYSREALAEAKELGIPIDPNYDENITSKSIPAARRQLEGIRGSHTQKNGNGTVYQNILDSLEFEAFKKYRNSLDYLNNLVK